MKKLFLTLLVTIIGATGFAQAPEKISYQAVVRDNGGLSITNQLVGVRVSILSGSSLGPEVFAETHGPTTNGYGLINLQIGTGANTGPALSTVDWGVNAYFVKIEIDPTGGTSYSVSSISQLLSVPYALYAKEAGNSDDADADPTNEYNTGAIVNADSLEITDGGGTIVVDMSSLKNDPDMDPNNEIQTLSKIGQVVGLSNGGGAFTDDVDDADPDPTNELITGAILVGSILQITDAGGIQNVDLSSLGGGVDPSITNELNTGFSLAGNILSITDPGNTFNVDLSTIGGDADPDPSNELQTITKFGNVVSLNLGGGGFIDDVDDADNDPLNEIQTANKVGNLVTISNGGGSFTVDDSDADATNEFNTGATLVGTDLSISDGGNTFVVDLSSLGGGADPSSTNELNTGFTLAGTILTITDPGNAFPVDLSVIQDGFTDADADPTNEYNTGISLTGTNLTITDGGGPQTVDLVSLSGGGDPSSTNELNTGFTLVGTTLTITDPGNAFPVDLSVLQDGFTDADADPTNEHNTGISLTGTSLTITDGGGPQVVDLVSLQDGVTDPDADPTNEYNTGISLTGTNLTITDAGGPQVVDLASLSGGGGGFYVGMLYQGGVIVYVDTSGIHGLIGGLADLGSVVFEAAPNETSGVFAPSFTDGVSNTAALVTGPGAAFGFTAAILCDAYSVGIYTDWYLPAAYELELMLRNTYPMSLVGASMQLGIQYWSSTEDPAAIGFNAYQARNSSVAFTSAGETNAAFVRPMRAF